MDTNLDNPLKNIKNDIRSTRKSLGTISKMENSLGTKKIKRTVSDRIDDIVKHEFQKSGLKSE